MVGVTVPTQPCWAFCNDAGEHDDDDDDDEDDGDDGGGDDFGDDFGGDDDANDGDDDSHANDDSNRDSTMRQLCVVVLVARLSLFCDSSPPPCVSP